MFTADDRRWSRWLEQVPEQVRVVHRWQGWRDPTGEGHLHHVPTLVLAIEGSILVRRGRQRLVLAAGEAVVIGPGVWHLQEPVRGQSAAWCQGFLPQSSDIQLVDSQGMRLGAAALEPSRQYLDQILMEEDPEGRRQRLQRLLREVLSRPILPLPALEPAVTRMIGALWSGAHLGLSAADLVAASGLARSRAYQLFTEAYGESPHQALLSLRLALAEGLLAAGLSVAAAARCSGFSSAHALARRRRLTGL